MLKNIWTKVRSAALLTTVEGQYHGKERRCNIGPTAMDGKRSAEERLDEGQDRRSSHRRLEAILRKERSCNTEPTARCGDGSARPAAVHDLNARCGGATNVGLTEEESARAVTGRVLGCPLCADDRHASGRGGATASGARVGGSYRCDCRDQRREEDNTARDNCPDRCHASGLFDRQRAGFG